MIRATAKTPAWVYQYHTHQPMPRWLRWSPFVVWIDQAGDITHLSVVLPNGLYLHAQEGDYIVRGPIGEITLLTPGMYEKYYQPVTEDTTHDEPPPTPAIPIHGSSRWREAAAEGIASA